MKGDIHDAQDVSVRNKSSQGQLSALGRRLQIPAFTFSSIVGQSKASGAENDLQYNEGTRQQAQREMRRRHHYLQTEDPVYAASEQRCRQRLEALLLPQGQSVMSAAA
jgi:hypothetical protein